MIHFCDTRIFDSNGDGGGVVEIGATNQLFMIIKLLTNVAAWLLVLILLL